MPHAMGDSTVSSGLATQRRRLLGSPRATSPTTSSLLADYAMLLCWGLDAEAELDAQEERELQEEEDGEDGEAPMDTA